MSIQNLSILTGATPSFSGGTAANFAPDGQTVAGGIHIVDTSVADFRLRPQMTLKTRNPKQQNGGYTKDMREVLLVRPMLDSLGVVQFNYIRVQRSLHPELAAASAADLLVQGAQLCVDSDLTNFWLVGSLG